jgi:hypothetical protein
MPPSGMSRRVAFLRSVLQLLVTANVLGSPILVTPLMEAICSSLRNICSYKSHTASHPRRRHSSPHSECIFSSNTLLLGSSIPSTSGRHGTLRNVSTSRIININSELSPSFLPPLSSFLLPSAELCSPLSARGKRRLGVSMCMSAAAGTPL